MGNHPMQALFGMRKQENSQIIQLLPLSRQWNETVHDGLSHLAQALWPDRHILRIVPVHDFRIRKRQGPAAYTWWVEHDIPPYDRFECAAYQVQLTLDEQSEPVMKVQSGTESILVKPINKTNLWKSLAVSGRTPPLIISRNMGEAVDP